MLVFPNLKYVFSIGKMSPKIYSKNNTYVFHFHFLLLSCEVNNLSNASKLISFMKFILLFKNEVLIKCVVKQLNSNRYMSLTMDHFIFIITFKNSGVKMVKVNVCKNKWQITQSLALTMCQGQC